MRLRDTPGIWLCAIFLCCSITVVGQSAPSDVSNSLAPSLSATPNSGASSSQGNSSQEIRSNVSNAVVASVNDSSMSDSAASVDSIAGLVTAPAIRSESENRSKSPTGNFQSGLTSTPKASDLNANQRFSFDVYQKDGSGNLSRRASASTPNRRKGFAASLNSMQPHRSAERTGIGVEGTSPTVGIGVQSVRQRVEAAGTGVEGARPSGAGIGVKGIRLNTELAGTGLAGTRADVEVSRIGLERTWNGDQDVAMYSLDFPDSTKGTALLSPYDPGEESPFTWNTSVSYEFQDLTRRGFLNPTLHVAAPSGMQTGMISRRAYKAMSVAERRRLRHLPASLLPKQTPGMGKPLQPDILNERGILGTPNILTNPGLNSSTDQ